jgi:hypothetical protein
VEELLSKRRLTILAGSDENLIDEDLENEDIIEGLLMLMRGQRLLMTTLLFSDDGVEA